ncbi:MAG: hypothetical protein OZSIB_3126 [Candidatus Ozemobacter sibiricus]|uniref:Uncharacterized protein n=1 Tax=Candidatus Ozemobacter sibiricus TaxID=2268124 RepID=A0A367ZQR2_9BACT|nr:MAG: hypothetical protein OZSIB_3126 [Candidatus Ozemobacter sibiricus]
MEKRGERGKDVVGIKELLPVLAGHPGTEMHHLGSGRRVEAKGPWEP